MTEEKKKTIISNIKNETREITTDPADIERIIKDCYEWLCTHKFDNLNEINQFLKKYKLPQLTQYER